MNTKQQISNLESHYYHLEYLVIALARKMEVEPEDLAEIMMDFTENEKFHQKLLTKSKKIQDEREESLPDVQE